MPLWLLIPLAWLVGIILTTLGWIRFMRPIREWEEERYKSFNLSPD